MKHLLEDVRIFMPTCSAHGKKNHFQAEESPTVRVLLLTYNPGIGCTTGSAWSFESCPLFGQTMLIFLFCSSVCVCVCVDSWGSHWRLRRKSSPSRPSLRIESVPVWPLQQFPPLLNLGLEATVVVTGRLWPLWGSAFVVLSESH